MRSQLRLPPRWLSCDLSCKRPSLGGRRKKSYCNRTRGYRTPCSNVQSRLACEANMNMSPLACSLLGAGYPAILHISHLTRITGESEQTIRNRLSQKNYPIPSSIVGGRRIFCLGDVASYIETIQLQTNQNNIRRGRPTKAKAMLMAKQDAVAPLSIED